MDDNTPVGKGYNDARDKIDRSGSGTMSWEDKQEYDRGQDLVREEKAREKYINTIFGDD